MQSNAITVETTVKAPIETVWDCFNNPEHITQWCQASDDWHAPYSENDLRVGGKLKTTMAAKDGSFQFDFEAVYSEVVPNKRIAYTLGDGREVEIDFIPTDSGVHIRETFDPETMNPEEMQRGGWQAILDSFKRHTESVAK